MKLTAIMLIINSFFASQQGIEVVSKVIDPIKHISADEPLSKIEFDEDAQAINTAATFCREAALLNQIEEANSKLMSFYQDIDGFDRLISKLSEDIGFNLVEAAAAIDSLVSSAKSDLQNKLTEFESQVLKRGRDLQQLDDVKLLRQVVNKASRFFSELRTLMAQATVVDVELTRSFLSEEDLEKISRRSSEHFKAMSA